MSRVIGAPRTPVCTGTSAENRARGQRNSTTRRNRSSAWPWASLQRSCAARRNASLSLPNWLACSSSASILRSSDGRDVDVERRSVRAPQVQLAHLVRRQAGGEVLGEVQAVARGRVHRVDGGEAGGAMVGVVHERLGDDHRLGVVGVHRERPELADLARDRAEQRARGDELAVGEAEEARPAARRGGARPARCSSARVSTSASGVNAGSSEPFEPSVTTR